MIALLLDALATFRLTKLVTHDTLTVEARDSVIMAAYKRSGSEHYAWGWQQIEMAGEHPTWADDVVPIDPDPPKLATLVTCPWCAGAWVALLVVIARRLAPKPWAFAAEVFALSAAAGLTAENLQKS